ncbi:MAG: RHS repeat-associated core domain-containing protein [Myxococcota bacterium]
MVRFGAREYDPQIGRWLSKDPILFDGGSNLLFSYVSSNPLNLRDESGLSDPCPPHPPPDPEKEKREQCYRSCQVNYVNCVNTNGPNFPCGKIRQDCRDECDIQHGKPYRRPEDCPEDMCQ